MVCGVGVDRWMCVEAKPPKGHPCKKYLTWAPSCLGMLGSTKAWATMALTAMHPSVAMKATRPGYWWWWAGGAACRLLLLLLPPSHVGAIMDWMDGGEAPRGRKGLAKDRAGRACGSERKGDMRENRT